MLASTAVMLGLYVQVPLELPDDRATAVRLIVSVLLLAVVVGWEILVVARSPYPGVRAAEAVAVSFPLLIFLFASTYVGMEQARPESFNEPLSRIDGVYLTVTILATVGFGDIVPTTEGARLAVTLQMVVNVLLIGVVAKILLGMVQQRRGARGATDHTDARVE
ncbi:MAG TPA: potassium channel family protein [Nocardioides sp.]|uniref:potassium channel family protein n=1 Tax=Nocardioides sp. TaxID=35761 RepID=UPI002D800FD5|nr:potassium channel family protein [Nocardioides sp.]HET6651751.1 potassium channel family protein [Nocardioides sp.]